MAFSIFPNNFLCKSMLACGSYPLSIPRDVDSQLELSIGGRPRGFGEQSPRKFFVTTPFSLPENEGNASFKTNHSKKLLTCSV